MIIYKERYLVSPCADIFDIKKNRWLTKYKHSSNYIQVFIHSKKEYLHRIVGKCYPLPNSIIEGREIDHLDTIKWHNCFLNLEWVTKSQNIKRSFDNGQNYTSFDRIRKMVDLRK